jgi:hypothetical protein
VPPPLASTLLVDAMLVVVLAFARAEAILVCGAAAVFAALRTVRVARRTAIGGRLAVAWGVAIGMPAEAALCTWQASPARTAAVAGAVTLAAVYAWVTSPALRR